MEFYKYPEFEMFGIEFNRQHNISGKYAYHVGSLDNLKVIINPRGLLIQNSLHKFYHGNNWGDFKYSEIKETVERIEEKFNMSSKNFKLKTLEAGINVEFKLQMHELCKLYIMDEFDKMKKGKNIYGKKVFKSDYDFKIYNKYLETKLNNDYDFLDVFGNPINCSKGRNRVEIKFKKMRAISSFITTLSDLSSNSNLEKLGNKITKYFDNVNFLSENSFLNNYDFTVLTPRQQELYFAGFNKIFWEVAKNNMNTRKKKRNEWKRCVKLLNETLINPPVEEFKKLILNKIQYLISN